MGVLQTDEIFSQPLQNFSLAELSETRVIIGENGIVWKMVLLASREHRCDLQRVELLEEVSSQYKKAHFLIVFFKYILCVIT